MPKRDFIKLDNPAWYALNEAQAHLSFGDTHTRFFLPEYCPFGGIATPPEASHDLLEQYAAMSNGFFVIGNQPSLPPSLRRDRTMICLQMVAENPIELPINQPIIPLNDNHHDALFQLVNLVQPGYFRQKTRLMGDYYGIFSGNELVAVAGERMKMDGFTEVSAIVNHPQHTGKGYASQLTAYTVNQIFEQDKTPFLHVVETNTHAIRLYERLGFVARAKIPFYHIIHNNINF